MDGMPGQAGAPQMPQGMPGQPPSPPATGAAGPAGSPMTNPQQMEGERAQGLAMAQTAIELLSMSLPMLSVQSEEGEAVLSALKSLSRKLGIKAQNQSNLMPAQIEMLRNSQVGGPDVATMLAMQGRGGQPQQGMM